MSLDLLSSSLALQYYSAPLQFTALEMGTVGFSRFPSNRSLFLKGSRLIQEDDGTLHVIQKTFGEVLGEKLIGPFIKCAAPLSRCFFSIIKQPAMAFDQLFTRCLHFLPEAAAASSDDTAVVVRKNFQSNILDYWTQLIKVEDKDCGNYVSISAEKTIAFGKDAELINNCNSVTESILKLNFFFLEQKIVYEAWLRELSVKQECQILQVIKENFAKSLEALQLGKSSRFSFSPGEKKSWVVQIPGLSSNDRQSDQTGRMTLNGENTAWHIEREESRECSVEEERGQEFYNLKRKLLQSFQNFSLSPDLSFADFKLRFSAEAIQHLNNSLPQLQKLIEEEFIQIESSLLNLLSEKNKHLQEDVLDLIKQICRTHETRALEKGYRFNSKADCRNWVVKDLFKNILFSFSMGEPLGGESIEELEVGKKEAFLKMMVVIAIACLSCKYIFDNYITGDEVEKETEKYARARKMFKHING